MKKAVSAPSSTSQAAGHLGEGSIQFIGTATVLLRLGGFAILTDPNFVHKGDHLHLGYGLFTKRLTNPALEITDLPPLDLVLLSHLHADHFDYVAEKKLNRDLPIITTRSAAKALRKKGFKSAQGLAPWRRLIVNKEGAMPLRITAMPGKHGPTGVSALLPPVMGTLLEFGKQDPFRIYISGDTLIHDDFRQIPKRVPGIDIALLHLGGTRVLGVLVTMDARQGVEAIRILKPRTTLPIHYNDYPVFKSPLEDFKREVEKAGLADQVRYLEHGDEYRFRFAEKLFHAP
jgi:L-ascorbate metabolism protein UlaG (beta-lactamase superfamily)